MAAYDWLDNGDTWTTAVDWSGGVVPTATDDVTIAKGDPQITTDVGSVASLAITAPGQATIEGGGALAVTGAFVNSGTLNLTGGASTQALLNVAGQAGFGTAGSVTGTVILQGDALLEFGGGEIGSIASGAALTLDGSQAFVADATATTSNSALTGLDDIAGTFLLNFGASATAAGDLTVEKTGTLGLDTDEDAGGSQLAIGGTLHDDGEVDIGRGPGDIFLGIESSDLVTAAAVTVATGASLNLVGYDQSNGTDSQAALELTGSAGFGTDGVLTGNINLYNDALLQFGGGGITSIAAGSELTLDGAKALVADATAPTSNSALDGLNDIAGALNLNYGASLTVSGDLTVEKTGTLGIDTAQDAGGSHLSITGTLVDDNDVQIGFGPGDIFLGIEASDLVTAAAVDVANGDTLTLVGFDQGNGTDSQAVLDLAGAAGFGTAGVLTGTINLYNDALLEFGNGEIESIAAGADLTLDGTKVYVADAGATTSSSALTGLDDIAGTLVLGFGASVAVSGDLTVEKTGFLGVDTDEDAGGSHLTIGGTLHDNSDVEIGRGPGDIFLGIQSSNLVTAAAVDVANGDTLSLVGNGSNEAELDVAGAAGFGTAGVLTGNINLYNDALLQFGSGEIETIAAGAELTFQGSDVFVADAGATTSSSALTGLTDVAGGLYLSYGTTLTTSGDLTVDSTGTLQLDTAFDAGGTTVTIGGTLINDGSVYIGFGPGDSFLGIQSSDDLSVGAIDNAANATLQLAGSGNPNAEATLTVAGPAGFGQTGVLSGKVDLYYDARLSFGSGSITSVASGAELTINGADALLIDAGTSGSDTALSGLASNAGSISLENGQIVSTTGDFTTSGFFGLDNYAQGSSFTAAGTFTNSGTVNVGNGGIGVQTFLRAGALDNQGGGTFTMSGSSAATAVLIVQGTVTNAGSFTLYNGVSAQAGGLDNSSILNLYGNTGVPTTLEDFGTATNSGTLTVGGNANLDVSGTFGDTGMLDVGGTLDVADGLDISGAGSLVMQGGQIITPGSAEVTTETGTSISGYGSLDLGLVDDATVTAQGGTLDVAGPVTGTGNFAIANASELELGSTAAQTVDFGGNVGTLKLDDPSSFTGNITGLVKGDTLDLAGVEATSVSLNGSTLTVNAGSETYSYQVGGNTPTDLTANQFVLEDDGQGGTDVVLGPPGPSIRGPKTQTVFTGYPAVLGPLSIVDPTAGNTDLTVTLTAGAGQLAASAAGAGTVSGNYTNSIVLSGTLADLNTELASVQYNGINVGSDSINIHVTDSDNRTASQNIAVNTEDVPLTSPVFNVPPELAIQGVPTALNGLSVSDPYAAATGGQLTLEVDSGDGSSYTATGTGGSVNGDGTSQIAISGTVSDINDYLSDALFIENLSTRLITFGKWIIAKSIQINPNAVSGPITGGLIVFAGAALGFLNEIGGVLTALGAATYIAKQLYPYIQRGLTTGKWGFDQPGIQLVAPDGLIYNFDAAGEFLFAKSTQTGNSFQVQVRLQPYDGSSAVSAMTQVAVAVGTDRVTFGVGRAATIMLDGNALALSPGQTVTLAGGQITQISATTYQVTWNTGETLTVGNHGAYLGIEVGLGSGDTSGTIVGLLGPDTSPANGFTLPDGTVLPQPLTDSQLYGIFANAWRITQSSSLFDYSQNQDTATFTNVNFPYTDLTLDDFPAAIVANAENAAKAAGLTDQGAIIAAAFDYIVSGGNPAVITDAASFFQGATTVPANIVQTGQTPSALGVVADQQSVEQSSSGATAVTFDVYLTAPAASDTVVDYSVVSTDAGDFTAADFGGTLPSGSVTIVAGQTMAQFTVDVPQGALGQTAQKNVDVQITSPGGTPIVASTAKETVDQPEPGPPAVPSLSYLGTFGNFTRNGNTYTLDLGAIQLGEIVPELQFGIDNTAAPGSDQLTGSFTVPTVAGFDVTGDSIPSPISAGSSYQGLTVGLVQDKFGGQSETITFNPVDTNASGFTTPLSPITLTITDSLELPSMIYSQAWGDVHIISYNGLLTNFQGAGEFTLAKSNIAGDTFDIQMRLEPWYTGASVTTIQQAAISLGTDDVTFDWNRPDTVYVNGSASTISLANPTLTLNGGTVTEISPSVYKVAWSTGETATFSEGASGNGNYINIVDGILGNVGPGAYSGLQGEDEGTQNDIQLADGTVLPQPVSSADLYGEYANSWRVSQATSLFTYLPGQSTATFTDYNFPSDALTLANLPANVVANAAAMVSKAGITDPGIAQAAELDYIATGDTSFITAAQNIQEFVAGTTPATVTPSTTTATAVGISADATEVTEATSGDTAVTFTAYLTGAESTDTTVDYAVVAPDSTDFTAQQLGGTLPSGTVTIAAGQTSASFTIEVPNGALGMLPSRNLAVAVTSSGGLPVFAPTAETEVVNPESQPGAPAVAQLAYLGQDGSFSFDASTNTYTLDLGNVTQGAAVLGEEFAVINGASQGSDNLGGTFAPPTGTGFTITGNTLPNPLTAGSVYQGLYASVKTAQLGPGGMTLVFDPTDVNDSGYSASLAPLTLKIVDQIVPPAQAQLNTPGTIIFPNVRVGTTDSQAVSFTNTAPEGGQSLDVTGTASASASVTGSIAQLAAGATDASSVTVGVSTTAAGANSGAIDFTADSDDGAGDKTPLEAADTFVDVFGAAYRPAAPTVTLSGAASVVHVGDPGTASLTVANTDPADGYSESLVATLAGVTGNVTSQGKTKTGEIAAGGSDATSFKLGFSTKQAGVISGNAIVGLTSDGGTGPSSIDGLGTLALPSQTVPITVTVDNYAQAGLAETSGGGTFATTQGGYTLDLGTLTQGSSPVTVALAALNTAGGPADLLAGSFGESGSAAFTNALGAVSGIGAGQSAAAGTVTLSTAATGSFSETVTFSGTGSNASGYAGSVAGKTLTITGTVVAGTGPTVAVSSDEASLNASSPPATITFAFSTAVTGFDAGDVTTTGGTIGAVTQSKTDPDRYTATFTPTAGFTGQGSVAVTAGSYTDLDGNPGAPGGTTIAEDLAAPAVAITTPSGTTQAPSQTIVGTGEAGTTVAVFDDGSSTPVGETEVGADGQWSLGLTLIAGQNTVVATDTDAAGNTGTSNSITLSLVAPSTPGSPGSPGSPTNNAPGTDTTPPLVGFDPTVRFTSPDRAILTGTVSDASGVATVEIYADSGRLDLGAATIHGDGTWSFVDTIRGDHQNFISAIATDNVGNSGTTQADYSLTANVTPAEQPPGQPYTAVEDSYDPSGTFIGETFFQRHGAILFANTITDLPNGDLSYTYSGGSFFDDKSYFAFTDDYSPAFVLRKHTEYEDDGAHAVTGYGDGVVFRSRAADTFTPHGQDNRFVFDHGFGHDLITSFTLDGPQHDTISLPKGDAARLAGILAHATTDAEGDAVLHLNRVDQITVGGTSVADLQNHPRDFTFHA